MLTVMHYLPYVFFTGLGALALVVLFGGDQHKKRRFPQRIRQHYVWKEQDKRRD
jgi:hypothetical protein